MSSRIQELICLKLFHTAIVVMLNVISQLYSIVNKTLIISLEHQYRLVISADTISSRILWPQRYELYA